MKAADEEGLIHIHLFDHGRYPTLTQWLAMSPRLRFALSWDVGQWRLLYNDESTIPFNI